LTIYRKELKTMTKIEDIEQLSSKKVIKPKFSVGDTVKVWMKVVEGEKERVQPFQGTVIRIRGRGTGQSFTVRKVTGGVGVERVFPMKSPSLSKVEILRRGKVRRAKLFYLRERKGKSARVAERKESSPSS
jgi:large subunit ribosomal protein L19